MIKESHNGRGWEVRGTKWIPDVGAIISFIGLALVIIGAVFTIVIRVETALASQGTELGNQKELIIENKRQIEKLDDNKMDKP